MIIIVENYKDGCVTFSCSKCAKVWIKDVSDMISDNCALDVEVQCDYCKEHSIVYILRCTDAALAKDLNAKLEVLRLNREAGVRKHGN